MKNRWIGIGAVLSLLLTGLPAMGQAVLAPIVVTARDETAPAHGAPGSWDRFSGLALEDAGVENVEELVRLSPNIGMAERSCEHIVVIRGISPFRSNSRSPAGFSVDGVSTPLHYMQNMDLFDLDRVEILKGPQGTTGGMNTESGLIRITTRRPGREFRGSAAAHLGTYRTVRSDISLSGPVTDDKLFLGGAFHHKSSNGYWENLSTGNDRAADQDHTGGRMALRWTPGDAWDITLAADLMDANDHGAQARALYGPLATGRHRVRRDSDAFLAQHWDTQSLRITRDAPAFTLHGVSAVLHQTLDKVNDTDLWDDPANQRINPLSLDERLFSQEIRLVSHPGGPFDWQAGLYGFIEASDYDYRYEVVSAGSVTMHPITRIDTRGAALFGQGTWRFSDHWRLTAGLRIDRQSAKGRLRDPAQGITCGRTLSGTELLPKLALSRDLGDGLTIYASLARGYLPGGFNFSRTGTHETFSYGPEYSLHHEIGIQSAWMDRRVTATLSAFHIDMDDKQVSEQHPTISAQTVTNAARARSQGVELQATVHLLPGLELFGGAGLTDSRYEDFTPLVREGGRVIEKAYSGNYLSYAPRYTYNAGLQYFGPHTLFGRIDLLGTGPFYGDPANTARQDAYETLNLRLGFQWRDIEFSVWGENLCDREYLTFITPFRNTIAGIDGHPQRFGISAVYRF